MAVATILHATSSQAVDIVLAFILMVGGVIGAQFGARIGQNLRGDQLRALLALLVLAVAVRFLVGLVATPDELFSLALPGGGAVRRAAPLLALPRCSLRPAPAAAEQPDRRAVDAAR